MRYGQAEDETHWHLNFANEFLFCAYGAQAFAQDEIQVAEHPVLASLREALETDPAGLEPRTREAGKPTPITIRGVPRLCAIDTDPDAAFPYGIYGRRFVQASPEALAQAVVPVAPTLTNLLAIEAPQGGRGPYARAEIDDALATAYAATEDVLQGLLDMGPRWGIRDGN